MIIKLCFVIINLCFVATSKNWGGGGGEIGSGNVGKGGELVGRNLLVVVTP